MSRAGDDMNRVDPDTLVGCVCGHRKDRHLNGVEYCKADGPLCGCHEFRFQSAEDRVKWREANHG